MHGGDGDARVVGAVLAQAHAGGRLAHVVELLLDAVDELLGEGAHADAPGRLDARLELAGGEAKDGPVAPHDVVDAGPLDLHDHAGPVVEHGAMGLADRGRRQRLELERREHLVDRLAELVFEHVDDVVARQRV